MKLSGVAGYSAIAAQALLSLKKYEINYTSMLQISPQYIGVINKEYSIAGERLEKYKAVVSSIANHSTVYLHYHMKNNGKV